MGNQVAAIVKSSKNARASSIQSIQSRTVPRTTEELINEVRYAFDSTTAGTLYKTFRTLQLVLRQIMSCGGCNDLRLPVGQMQKDNLLAAGTLHEVIPCDAQAFIDAHQSITTLSALQVIPTLPTPQLATASECTGTHHSTAGQQHTTSPMSSVSATPPSDLHTFICELDLCISYNRRKQRGGALPFLSLERCIIFITEVLPLAMTANLGWGMQNN
ncbi:unnamed protein product [Phytophthora fragariaefolia]|uniref:Unnamed protein product n=1 Tax=Phytophthora fragariaefolia TaxID=1490495 RepID=A0A9W7CTU9_9STRA|nr:unnamed protein product [Phytophthora fragariaefolia]